MTRQPTLFISHGGGPCFWMEFPEPMTHAFDPLRDHLGGLLATLPARPKAILAISAHWEEDRPTVTTSPAPGMLYDYYGFPEHTYRLRYPAPGSPVLARRVGSLLDAAGIDHGEDAARGFDHGIFVPFLILDPKAEIPVVVLSLRGDLDPAKHLALGAALAPLRDEGVLIVGSGNTYHNLRKLFGDDDGASGRFDDWLTETVQARDAIQRNARLVDWDKAPAARECHPREEHLLPLMVAAGAAQNDQGRRIFHDMIVGRAASGYAFGLTQ